MRVFVISLIGHPRRKEVNQHLSSLGIDFDFFDAVDGSNLTAAHKALIDVNQTLINIPRGLTDREYACALSHALLYEKIVVEKISHALILEDDAIVTTDLKMMLDAYVFEKSDFDLMLLCYLNAWYRRWSFKKFFKGYQSFRIWNAPFRTTAYYINSKAAKNLFTAAIPVSSTADWPVGAFKGIKTACIQPQVVIHPKLPLVQSSLHACRVAKDAVYKANKPERTFLFKLKRNILITFFVPKRYNNQLPHFWLKLLGSRISGK